MSIIFPLSQVQKMTFPAADEDYYLVLLEMQEEKEHLKGVLAGPFSKSGAEAVVSLYRTAYEKWYQEEISVEIMTETEMQSYISSECHH